MTAEVREMTPADDLEALGEGSRALWVARWWRGTPPKPGAPIDAWFVGLLDGEPVGFAVCVRLPVASDGRAASLVHVVPRARRRGVGAALGRAVVASLPDDLPGVEFGYVADETDAEAAVQAWGLPEVARHHESVLDLTALDRDDFEARARVPGVVLEALPDLDLLDDDAWATLHVFAQQRIRETPDAGDGGGEFGLQVFRSSITDSWGLVTARRDGELIGITFVMRRPGTDTDVVTLFTGVVAAERGRGVATALKCRHALLMVEAGMTSLSTQNMAGNEPILAANRRLGFVPGLVRVDVVVDR